MQSEISTQLIDVGEHMSKLNNLHVLSAGIVACANKEKNSSLLVINIDSSFDAELSKVSHALANSCVPRYGKCH